VCDLARQVQHHFGQQLVLGDEHPRGEGVRRVVGSHRHTALRDDGAAIVLLVDVVDRGARLGGPARQHGLVHPPAVHPGAAEVGEQSRVDINQPVTKPRDGGSRDELQVTREHHEVRISEGGQQLVGIGGVAQDGGRYLRLTGPFQRARGGAVGDDAHYPGGGVRAERIEQRLQVRAAAGGEHGDTNRRH
jgi:hypothetical protein